MLRRYHNSDQEAAKAMMLEFADLTGLSPIGANPRRYLWTDAFAVCNFLEIFCQTNDKKYHNLALDLIYQVHHILGKHRSDDRRRGWISGLDDLEAEQHPTIVGLRIGKHLNERKQDEPLDETLEWDQDGQYYHYLTKWMHALNSCGEVTSDPTYVKWAIELAKTAHSKFTYTNSSLSRKRMYWKMSIDLTYPLVLSMGQHDPLDGFVTYNELQAASAEYFSEFQLPGLKSEITDMAKICQGINLVTNDPLGIGGLLFDASRIAQLILTGYIKDVNLLEIVLKASLLGIRFFVKSDTLKYPANIRLAFRELGLSIGLTGVEKLHTLMVEHSSTINLKSIQQITKELMVYYPLKEQIEQFWMDERNVTASTWIEHHEINMVMLATSLAPKRFLSI